MHRARPCFERNVIAQNPQRIALQKRMLEHRPVHHVTGEFRDHLRRFPPANLGRRRHQILGDDVNIVMNLHRRVNKFRMIRDRHVRRHGPRRRGPDQAPNLCRPAPDRSLPDPSQRESNPDRRAGMILILDLGLRQRRPIVNAPVHRLQALVNIARDPENRRTPPRSPIHSRRSWSGTGLPSAPVRPAG